MTAEASALTTEPVLRKPGPGLHIVATPIGNLGDLSPRALSTLKDVDLLLCEDTRVTGKLLKVHGIGRSMQAYHEHNATRVRPRILDHLAAGKSVALVSDAGTPLISDPGYKLVGDVIEAGHEVLAVPGPSAALAALVVSGLPTDRFMMAGFLPSKAGARQRMITSLAGIPASLIFYEAPQRLQACLRDLSEGLGDRPAAVARELTKRFEEVRRGTLDELALLYEDSRPKGEIVIVIGPPDQAPPTMSAEQIDDALTEALATMSVSSAAATVAAATGQPKRDLYQRAIALRQAGSDEDETPSS